jgi:hypothetical protein
MIESKGDAACDNKTNIRKNESQFKSFLLKRNLDCNLLKCIKITSDYYRPNSSKIT